MEYENIGKSLAGTEWGQTKGAETIISLKQICSNTMTKENLI